MTESADSWVVDTDIQIHRLGIDEKLSAAANGRRDARRPVSISSFSLLELKGNYIADLILLRRKLGDSADIKQVFARVQSTGGRRSGLMLAQLVNLMGGIGFLSEPWVAVQSLLITHTDAQILAVWKWFTTSVDSVVDDLECTRAAEAPRTEKDRWIADIPSCRKGNTKCRVVQFIRDNDQRLRALHDHLRGLPEAQLTRELKSIATVLETTFTKKAFPWEGTTCRSVGDLLIGLHAVTRQGLVTSNSAEHAPLSQGLGYPVDLLPVGGTRLT